jgi:hypothetical protein
MSQCKTKQKASTLATKRSVGLSTDSRNRLRNGGADEGKHGLIELAPNKAFVKFVCKFGLTLLFSCTANSCVEEVGVFCQMVRQ